ncbi:MAG: D-2-hydroxyacid dehydrogenase [Actinobacteria bacterium]|nr:D-2-hydroxyacid dehydrogenase [Actinomycetota bacterium]
MSSRSDPRVVLHPAQGRTIEIAFGALGGIVLDTPSVDAVAAALDGAEILVSYPWRDEFLTPSLRWVQSVSAGTEQFPAERLREAGVALTSARGIHGPQVAEHALALLLAMTRGVGRAALDRRDRVWKSPPVTEIGGMTMGVIGLGVIGEAVAERAKALGMRVVGTKRDITGYRGAADRVVPAESMDEVFAEADVVVITLPGGAATRDIVGAAQMEALAGGWLINVGRGSVIDEAALAAALAGGVLQGAGLDVFETEPLPGSSPLWDLPNLVMTPHVAGASPHYGDRLADLFVRNLAAYRGDGDWINRVV